eukprot:scaffold1792_cov18-Tisochrysis_lutea.AAC.2
MHAHTHMLVRMHAGTYPLPFAPFTTHRHTHAQTCMLEHAYYKKCLSSKLEGEERQKELSACHERGAERLLQLCFANGGVYTKLGQHIGQLLTWQALVLNVLVGLKLLLLLLACCLAIAALATSSLPILLLLACCLAATARAIPSLLPRYCCSCYS